MGSHLRIYFTSYQFADHTAQPFKSQLTRPCLWDYHRQSIIEMDNFLLQAIVTELEPLLVGGRLGKIYQIGATDLAIDLRLRDGRWLIVSTDPQRLALYLTKRNPREGG